MDRSERARQDVLLLVGCSDQGDSFLLAPGEGYSIQIHSLEVFLDLAIFRS